MCADAVAFGLPLNERCMRRARRLRAKTQSGATPACRARSPIRARTAAVYPAIYLVQYLVSAGLLHLLVERAGLGSRLAGFVAMVLVVPLSFVLNRALLRRREGTGP